MKKFTSIILLILFLTVTAIPVQAADINTTLNFSDDEYVEDSLVKEYSYLHDFFYIEQVGDEPNFAQAKFSHDGDYGKVLKLNGYFSAMTYDAFDSVSFSADVRIADSSGNGAIFFRASEPVVRYNPKNSGDGRFAFYEWDWYTENGGKINKNGGNMGNSGCAVMPLSNGKLLINFKTHETDGLFVGNYPIVINNAGTSKDYYNIKIEDINNVSSVYVNDVLLAKVEMSEPGVYEDDKADPAEYYKHAKVTDATGAVLAEFDNARLAVANRIAFASRGRVWFIKSMTIKTGDKISEGELTKPADTAVPETNAPETLTPETKSPETAAQTTDNVTEEPHTEQNTDKEGLYLTLTVIGCAVTIIAVIGSAVLTVKKKK